MFHRSMNGEVSTQEWRICTRFKKKKNEGEHNQEVTGMFQSSVL